VPADPQLPTGTLALAVPAYSAIKVDGERLYAKARRGEEFTPPTREMTVYRAERMSLTAQTATFEIECAGGTYVRSVVATLEDAFCEQLVRTRVGELRLEDADPEAIVAADGVLSHLPPVDLSAEEALSAVHGKRFEHETATTGETGARFRLRTDGNLIGVARIEPALDGVGGVFRPETMLAGSPAELEALI
jgi:tRNA U55 pseudouridine synthase TruB